MVPVATPALADTVYVSDERADVLHVIDGATGAVQAKIPVGARPRGMALSPDGATLYVKGGRELWGSSEVRGLISIFDPATRKIIGEVDLVKLLPAIDPVQAVELVVSRDGKRLFVALGRGNHVAEIDPVTRKPVR